VFTREALPAGVLHRRMLLSLSLSLSGLGADVGLKRVADGLANGDRRAVDNEVALRRIRASHVTRDNLRAVIRKLVNATLADPAWWGDGTACASDSKKFGSWWCHLDCAVRRERRIAALPYTGRVRRVLISERPDQR
jgi:hypothetical protein